MSGTRLATFVVCLAALALPTPASALYSDTPQPGQLRINCGATNLYMPEQYLDLNSGSLARLNNDTGLFTNSTARLADNSAYFSYHVPVAPTSSAPLYLSLQARGQIKLTVEGTVLLNATTGYTNFVPFEFTLTNTALWADGYVDVRFDDAVPADGNGPAVAWVELWHSSEWRERIRHVLWDTSDIVWNLGGYDGRENEFRGTATDFTIGNDSSQLTNRGTLLLRWNQTVTAGKQYFILTAVRNVGNSFTLDMRNDGSTDYTSSYVNTNLPRGWYWAREVMGRLDITDQVSSSNVLKLTLAPGGPNPDCLENRLDCIALVEVTPGHVRDDDLRLVFKGNEQADHWTRLLNTTMFFSGHLYLDWSSGEFRTSAPNGQFAWYGGDTASQQRELAKWGYYDAARQAAHYLYYTRNIYTDNQGGVGSSAQAASSIAYLMMLDNYTGAFVADMYPALQWICNAYAEAIETDARSLTKETHYEGGGPYHTTADNTATYTALRYGAQVAGKLGQPADATRWSNAASNQLNGISAHLILSAPMVWTNYTGLPGWPPPAPMVATNTLPAGTFLYGLNDSGVVPTNAYAGLWTGGHHEELFFGYRGDAAPLSAWRAAMDEMLEYHPDVNFTADWRRHGDNFGVGTSYGALSEGGGRIMTSMLLSDRLDLFQKNLMHVIWNSTDMNFDNVRNEETFGEISPWVLVYDIDKQDNRGWYSSEGWDCEDMNGVEYADCMKNARVMAGIDDLLYNGDSLIIMPRLPVSWNELKVNQWPVAYRDGTNIGRGTVTFDFTNEATGGSIRIAASTAMSGVRFRLGPFATNALVSMSTLDGVATPCTREVRGSACWVWMAADIGVTPRTVAVGMTNAQLKLFANFADGTLAGWTTTSGIWSNAAGRARVIADGAARSAYGSATGATPVVAADIKVESASLSNSTAAAGIGLWQDDAGAAGYTLVADLSNRTFRLMRDDTVLASDTINLKPNRTYRLKMVVGTNIDCYLDEVRVFSATGAVYTSGKPGLFATNGAVCFDNVVMHGVTPPVVDTNNWTAYNDCAWQTATNFGGQGVETVVASYSTRGINTDGTNWANGVNTGGNTWTGGSLVTTNGYPVPVVVTYSGAAGFLLRDIVLLPGTDAAAAFSGKIGQHNAASWGAGTLTMTLSNLSAASTYDMVIWSTRGGQSTSYSNRWTDIVIEGADAFTNNSSVGCVKMTRVTGDDMTRVHASSDGHVARYDGIQSGADGTIVFTLTANGTNGQQEAYLNGFALRAARSQTNAVPDDWKIQYFGATTGPGTGDFEDYDQDGFNNYSEWRAGSDPTNASSRLEFDGVAAAPSGATNQIVLTWGGVTGRTYGVLGSTNLSGTWVPQQTGIPGVSPMNTVTVPVANPAGFWRVRVE